MKRLVKLVVAIAVMLFAAGQYINWSNRDIKALTESRHAALSELRPVLLRYKAETGRFPNKLDALSPKYLQQIPAVLNEQVETEAVKRIRYESDGENAQFVYHVVRGPDSTEVFDVTKNTFSRNR
jgi:hypothetical protein